MPAVIFGWGYPEGRPGGSGDDRDGHDRRAAPGGINGGPPKVLEKMSDAKKDPANSIGIALVRS